MTADVHRVGARAAPVEAVRPVTGEDYSVAIQTGAAASVHAGCAVAHASAAAASSGTHTTLRSPRASSCSASGAPWWSAAMAAQNLAVDGVRRARRNVIAPSVSRLLFVYSYGRAA